MSADLSFIEKGVDAAAAAGQKYGFEKAKLQIVNLLLDEMIATKDAAQTAAIVKLIGKVRQLQDVQA